MAKRKKARKSVTDHNYVKIQRTRVICDYCKKEFRKSNIANHIKKHLSTNTKDIKNKNIICKYCNVGFGKRAHLRNHIQSNHEISEELKKIYFKCEFCCTYFKNNKWLSRHVKEHHMKTKEAVVDPIENEFSDLIRNLKALNSQSQPDILAQAIGDTKLDFVPNIDLRKIKILEKDKKCFLKCDLCSYKTERINFLKRHLISHSNAKEHECPHCHKKYGYIANLKAHLKLYADKGCIKTYNYKKKKVVKSKNKNLSTKENEDSNLLNLSTSSMDMTSFSADDSILNNIIKDIPDELPPNISDIDSILNDKKENTNNDPFNNLIKINIDPRTFVTNDGVTCDVVKDSKTETIDISLNSEDNNNLNEVGENVNRSKIKILSDITIKSGKEILLRDNLSSMQDLNATDKYLIGYPVNGQLTESEPMENTETRNIEITLNDMVVTDKPISTLLSDDTNNTPIVNTDDYNIDEFINNLNPESNQTQISNSLDDIFNTNMVSPIYDDISHTEFMPNADEEIDIDKFLTNSLNGNHDDSTMKLNDNYNMPTDLNISNLKPNIPLLECNKFENETNNCVDMNNVLKFNYFEEHQEDHTNKNVATDTSVTDIDNADRMLNEKIKIQNLETEKLFVKLLSETTIKSFYKSSYPHVCDICNKKFKRKSNLKEHIDNVHSEKQFICDKCGKTFKCRRTIVNHLLLHTRPWTVKCQICEATLARTSLTVHMRKHNNETPFVCLLCGKRFGTYLSKKSHIIKYHLERDEDKPREPDLMDLINELNDDKTDIPIPPLLQTTINDVKKQYHRKEKKVTNAMSYTCSTCNKTFKAKHTLKRHEKIHEKKIVCECGAQMISRKSLLSHKIRYHNPRKIPTNKQ